MPKTKSFEDVDRELDALSKRVPKAALLEGHQLDDIDLTTTIAVVAHKLGRPWRGYVVVRRDAGADVWDESDGKADARTNIHLQASAPVTVSLWVY